jgi:hypothetical protein
MNPAVNGSGWNGGLILPDQLWCLPINYGN